jgi:hypothetical protein
MNQMKKWSVVRAGPAARFHPPWPGLVASLVALIGFIGWVGADSLWQSYVDPVLRYSITYPAGLFDMPPVYEHGGVTLQSSSGAKLFIFGGPNQEARSPETAASQLSRTTDVYRVTYRQTSASWLVLSGYVADGPGGAPQSIFYERIAFSPDRRALAGFRLVYREDQRGIFDRLIATIGNSLRPPLTSVASLVSGPYPPVAGGGSSSAAHEEWCRRKYSTYDAATDSFLRYDGQRVACDGPSP